jgi:pyruvate/2-oxoglutarate dehydrogenase complex dihydrolipoamide dehydrogenase (E3) component
VYLTCHARDACRIVKNGEDSYSVTYRAGSDGPEQTLEVGLVMMATGRHPRVAGLNLQVRFECKEGGCVWGKVGSTRKGQ